MAEKPSMMELYKSGLNDVEIGEKLGITRYYVLTWRKGLGLSPNASFGGSTLPRINYLELLKLYRSGLSDKELASTTKHSLTAIANWRKRNNFKPNKNRHDRVLNYHYDIQREHPDFNGYEEAFIFYHKDELSPEDAKTFFLSPFKNRWFQIDEHHSERNQIMFDLYNKLPSCREGHSKRELTNYDMVLGRALIKECEQATDCPFKPLLTPKKPESNP